MVNEFHRIYYYSNVWDRTYFLGKRILKCPLDLWTYQEIFFELKPDVVVECGTRFGGSAYYMARLFDWIGQGRVITIDIESHEQVEEKRPLHERITYLIGSSTDRAIVEQVRALIQPHEKVLVILDSDHSARHVLEELRLYHLLVSTGSYLIVEDTNINGHPVLPRWGAGPMEALDTFLTENQQFVVDSKREKFMMTQNPRGYLLKVK